MNLRRNLGDVTIVLVLLAALGLEVSAKTLMPWERRCRA